MAMLSIMGFLVARLALLATIDEQCWKAVASAEEPLPVAWKTEEQNSLFFLFPLHNFQTAPLLDRSSPGVFGLPAPNNLGTIFPPRCKIVTRIPPAATLSHMLQQWSG